MMSIDETMGFLNEEECCLVCGKGLAQGGGFARIKDGDIMVSLCCPLCLETFQNDPTPYRVRLVKIEYYRALKRAVLKPSPS